MTTPNLQIPEVPQAILTASDELNAGHWIIDALLQLSVLAMDEIEPPDDAVQGDRYIIPAGAIGVWAGRTNHIAYLGPLGWIYLVPRPGHFAWLKSDGIQPGALFVYTEGEWFEFEDGGGSDFGSPPTLRGTSEQFVSNTNSQAITFPAGSAVGDLALVATHHAFNAIQPSGWRTIDNQTGTNTNGALFAKVLTSGDIATGSVTITYGGAFDGYIACATFQAGTFNASVPYGEHDSVRSSLSLTNGFYFLRSGTVAPNMTAFLFGGSRGNGTVTFNAGTVQQTHQSTNTSDALALFTPTHPLSLRAEATFGNDGNGAYFVSLLVNGA